MNGSERISPKELAEWIREVEGETAKDGPAQSNRPEESKSERPKERDDTQREGGAPAHKLSPHEVSPSGGDSSPVGG
jgi:hypothetical protein